MSTLVINKKSLKTWLHTDSILGSFIISKFYFNADGVNFQIVEQGQSKRVIYAVSDITIIDDTNGGAEYGPYGTITELSLQLEALKYPAFYVDGSFNSITGLIEEGTNVTITGSGTESDPYVISSSGGGGATPDLQAVTDEGATTTNPIVVQDTALYFTEVVNDGNRITSKVSGSGDKVWEVGSGTDLTLAQYNASDLDPVQRIQFNNSGDLNQIFRVPNKPTGDYTLATLDDIITPDLQAVTDEGAITTNPITLDGGSGINFTQDGEFLGRVVFGGTDLSFGGGDAPFDKTGVISTENLTTIKALKLPNVGGYDIPDRKTLVASLNNIYADDNGNVENIIVVNSNTTAVDSIFYTVVANATFTDPTPTEGKGYVVYVRNGTATIGGTGYAVGSLVFRFYHSGAWSTREYKSNLTIDATPTNGSANAVQSDGVFDALALKADKATTRQIIRSKNNGTFGSHTGNTAETVLLTIPITGGEFEIGDWMDFMFQFERLVTGTNINVRLRAGTNGNTSDAQIALLTMVSATLDSAIKRERFEFTTGNILKGMNSASSATVTDIANITASKTSTSLNPTNNWYLTISATLGSGLDTILCTGYQIGKTKTF